MKIAVMQPYLFPYIGYWQLLANVDRFVVFDDAAFIPRGWIHRNRIVVNGAPYRFTLPVANGSQNRLICDIVRADNASWRDGFTKTLRQSYAGAENFNEAFLLVTKALENPERNLAKLLVFSLASVCEYLGIHTEIIVASGRYGNRELRGQTRILDICEREGARSYLNLPGGEALYERASFEKKGIELKFLRPSSPTYSQRAAEFFPWLSIIDVMMHCGAEKIRAALGDFSLR